jgi:methylase of polypeptide subunit release factors
MNPKQQKSTYLTERWNGLDVYFTRDIAGGQRLFADDFLVLLNGLAVKPRYGHLLEWCSGPGFIGYSMMAHGLCSSLTLAEQYGPALEAAARTAKANDIDRLVTLHKSLDPAGLPPGTSFDLVVGNPPYFPNRVMLEEIYKTDPKYDPRLYVDEGWRLHKIFFAGIRRFLARNGLVILLESTIASHLETFRPMIEGSGLRIAGWQWATLCDNKMWYLFISRDDATESFGLIE